MVNQAIWVWDTESERSEKAMEVGLRLSRECVKKGISFRSFTGVFTLVLFPRGRRALHMFFTLLSLFFLYNYVAFHNLGGSVHSLCFLSMVIPIFFYPPLLFFFILHE